MKNSRVIFQLLLLFTLFTAGAGSVSAQRGLGFRFGTSFNHFYRSESYKLIDGSWSQVVIGAYFQEYFSNGGLQVGLNLFGKNNTNRGFPNLPLVMRDFNGPHNVGVTGMELDFKVGPRFGPLNPKIGYILGFWFKREGFIQDTTQLELNKMYMTLPFALSAQLPTGYGSVSLGISYDVGLTNIIKKPAGSAVGFNGSRIRSFRVELTILFGFRRQEPKNTPAPPIEE